VSEKARRVMSLMGHKRTYAPQKAMSALPPIATAKADLAKYRVRFTLESGTCDAAAHVCYGPIADIRPFMRGSRPDAAQCRVDFDLDFAVGH
jgi:hypothetical protein